MRPGRGAGCPTGARTGRALARARTRRIGSARVLRLRARPQDELVRGLGVAGGEAILAAHGKLAAFRTYQKQPAHRARPAADQLRGFLTNWKVELAGPLVAALDPARIPRPLDGVVGFV
ncbi:MAG TPA: hypothetical protein VGJ11_07855 [Gaiellales bacterium]